MAALSVALLAGCGDDDGSATDAGPDADLDCSEPALGCPCPSIGEVICTTGEPGPDLICLEDGWGWSADGPCPGLDAGPRPDAFVSSDGGDERDLGVDGSASGPDLGVDGGPPDLGMPDLGPPAEATYCVDIDVSNTCVMTVSPTEITIPAGQTAYFCWRNQSADYAVDVWLSYGGGYTDLPPGATWDEPVGHCLGPSAHTEYADISTACSEHRFLIDCL
jgi:hypothetical protein